MELRVVRLIKMCLNETYNKVRIGEHLSDDFPIRNGLKQADPLSSLLSNFTLEYAIRKVQQNQAGLKFNVIHQLLVCADDIHLQGDNVNTIKKNIDTLIDASEEVDLEVTADKIKYMLLSRYQNAGKNHSIKIAHPLKMCHSSNIWEWQ
jgi:hypothetical protein